LNYYQAFSSRIASPWTLNLPSVVSADSAELTFFQDNSLKLDYPLPYTLGKITYGTFGDNVGVHIPWVGDFEIRGSDSIALKPQPEATSESIALYFTGLILGFQLRQKKLITFHGSAVVTPKGALIFTGDQGAGKSTTAAAFSQKGFPMLCDDVVPVTQGPWVHPGIPRPKLLPDAFEKLIGDPNLAGHLWDGVDKFQVDLPSQSDPQKLRGVLLLVPDTACGTVTSRQIKGMNKFSLLLTHLQSISGLDRPEILFSRLGEWMANVPVFEIRRPLQGDHLNSVLNEISRLMNKELL